MKKRTLFIISVCLISCQTKSPRVPAAVENQEELKNLVNLVYEKNTMKNVNPAEVFQQAKIITPASANIGLPISVSGSYKGKWRDRREYLNINRLADFEIKNGQIQRVYGMDRVGAKDYTLDIQSFIFSKEPGSKLPMDLQQEQPVYPADITCDMDYKLKVGLTSAKAYRANQKTNFRVYESSVNGQKVLLSPAEGSECQLTWNLEGKKYGVRIVTDHADPNLALNEMIDGCFLPEAGNLRGVEKFFLTDKFNSMTCVDSAQNIETLEDPVVALRSKVEVLLGQAISEEFLKAYDPHAPLDFSNAPHFDSIYVSYLVFRADFYGSLLSRLLEFHADRGTRVKILVSDVIALKKDRAMFDRMTQRHNNIKIQEYRYVRQKGEKILRGKFDEFHRTMHVKLLITTSKERPEWNVTYIGGRNIHDGFVFKNLPRKAHYLDMVDYGDGGDESFCHWRDFEIKVQDQVFTKKAAAHFLTLWNYDAKTLAVRSINQNIRQSAPADQSLFNSSQPLIRHFMSFPYKDNHSLEVFYSDMVDAAEKHVKISTPYFRPTKMFTAALERAVKRGVEVTLITRLDLEGDTISWLLSDANKAAVNQFWDKIRVFEYMEPKVILHSKIVLVDGKFSFVGSVNLNKRSFYHDLENGLMIYSPEFNKRMEDIYAVYLSESRRITGKLQTSPVKKVILDMFDTEF